MTSSIPSISHELAGIKLPDKRLKQRSCSVLEGLYRSPDKSLPATFGGRAELKAAYRFFNQPSVTPEAILEPHIEKTFQRINQYPTVFLVDDTTDIDMSHMSQVDNLGVLNNVDSPGCILHVLKAFTPDRLALGIAAAKFITRTKEQLGERKSRSTPIEKKESYRWLEHYRKASEIAQNTSSHIIYIADREADIYELLYEAQGSKADVLIRGTHNRSVLKSNGVKGRLIDELENSEPIENIEFKIPEVKGKRKGRGKERDTKARQGRQVKQEVRILEVKLSPGKDRKKKLAPIKVNVLYLKEVETPQGEKPINWLLLTTLKIENKEKAKKVINYYLSRWGIETFFHVLKNGCEIEELQFENSTRLLSCISMYMIVAWRIMYTMMIGRLIPDIACSMIFEEDEWECAYAITKKKKPPGQAPTMGEMVKMIAIMGGYLGRKGDGPPGPKVMWIGMQKLYHNTEGWSAHKNFVMST